MLAVMTHVNATVVRGNSWTGERGAGSRLFILRPPTSDQRQWSPGEDDFGSGNGSSFNEDPPSSFDRQTSPWINDV